MIELCTVDSLSVVVGGGGVLALIGPPVLKPGTHYTRECSRAVFMAREHGSYVPSLKVAHADAAGVGAQL